MTERVGFVGLGRMGRGMAINLVKAGFKVAVFDTSPEAAAALVSEGAVATESLAELAESSEVVFTSLPGPSQIEQVVFRPDGLMAHLKPGSVLVDTSTNSYELTMRLHEVGIERGIDVLDAPISGGPEGAAAGTLAIWVGGDREVFDRSVYWLKAIGSNTVYVGGAGSGTVVKLVHNLSANMVLANLAEAFSLAVKAGVGADVLWRALKLGVVGKQSPLELMAQRFMSGVFEPPGMTLELSRKDIRLASDLAHDLGVPARFTALIMQELTEAVADGLGLVDAHAVTQVQLRRARVSVAGQSAALGEPLPGV